jgi:hypothetical protein
MSCLGVHSQFPVTYMEVGWHGLVLNEMINSKYQNNFDTLVFTQEASYVIKRDTIRVRRKFSFCKGLFIGQETYNLSGNGGYNTNYEYSNGYIHQIYEKNGDQKKMSFLMVVDSVGSNRDVVSVDSTHQFVRTYDDCGRVTSLSNTPSKNQDCMSRDLFGGIFGDRHCFDFIMCDSIRVDTIIAEYGGKRPGLIR